MLIATNPSLAGPTVQYDADRKLVVVTGPDEGTTLHAMNVLLRLLDRAYPSVGYRRFYSDGAIRSSCLATVNDYRERHIFGRPDGGVLLPDEAPYADGKTTLP